MLAFAEYGKMRDGLNATGRHIYFSLCGWNNWCGVVWRFKKAFAKFLLIAGMLRKVRAHSNEGGYTVLTAAFILGDSLGNSWRIAGDCNAWPSIYNAIRTNEVLAQYARPGGAVGVFFFR